MNVSGLKSLLFFVFAAFISLPTVVLGQTSTIAQIKHNFGQTVTIKGLVTRAKGRFAHIQDGTGSIGLYQNSGTFKNAIAAGTVAMGDTLTVTGVVSDTVSTAGYAKIDVASFSVVNRNNRLVAEEITLAQLSANGEAYENKLVRVRDIQIFQINSLINFQSGQNYPVKQQGVGYANVAVGILTTGGTINDTEWVGKPIPLGQTVVFEGVVRENKPNATGIFTYTLSPIFLDDIYKGDWVSVFHLNNMESYLENTGLSDFGGAARAKTLLENLKLSALQAGQTTLTVGGGGYFRDCPTFQAGVNASTYYDAQIFNQFGFDAAGLNEEDFKFAPDILANFIGQTSVTPFLNVNLDLTTEPSLQALATSQRLINRTVLTKNGVKYGFLGVVSPALADSASPRRLSYLSDAIDAAQNAIDDLKLQGANRIILISSLESLALDSELVSQLKDVDLVVSGSGINLLTNAGVLTVPDGTLSQGGYPMIAPNANFNYIPLAATAGKYGYVGRLVVEFDENGKLRDVKTDESKPVRVAGGALPDAVLPNASVQTLVNQATNAANALQNSLFAQSSAALDARKTQLQRDETNFGNLVADAVRWQAEQLALPFNTQIARTALLPAKLFSSQAILPAGAGLNERASFDSLPLPFFLTTVTSVSPARLKQLLEHSVAELTPSSGSEAFAQISGFKVLYDLTKTAQVVDANGAILVPGQRVQEVVLENGTKMVQNGVASGVAQPIAVVTADYFGVNQGLNYPFQNLDRVNLGVTYRQALVNYCKNTLNQQITASEYPAGGDGRISFVVNFPETLTVCNSTILDAGSEANSYLWNTGATTQTLNVSQSGQFSVEVTYINNRVVKDTVQVLINATPTAQFSAAVNFNQVTFTNLSTGLDNSYVWHFGEGVNSTQTNPVKIYPNQSATYQVKLVVTNACGKDSVTVPVTVQESPIPTPVAQAAQNSVCPGAPLQFANGSLGADAFEWNFGDGQTSTDFAPTHIFATPGNFDVILKAINTANGNFAQDTLTITVLDAPKATLTVNGSLSLCLGDSVKFTAASSGNYTYNWFQDGVLLSGQNQPALTVKTAGSYYLIASASTGCADTSLVFTVSVGAALSPVVQTNDGSTICGDYTIRLFTAYDANYSYQWKKDGQLLAGETDTALVVTAAGAYQVVVTSPTCVAASTIFLITKGLATPAPSIQVGGSATFCAGDSLKLFVDSDPSLSYFWLRNGQKIAGSEGDTYYAKLSGGYQIVAVNAAQCADTSAGVVVTVLQDSLVIQIEGNKLTAPEGNSYQWFLNGNPIPHATQQTLNTQQSGVYTVAIGNASGCAAKSLPITFVYNSLDEVFSNSIRCYPNPTTGLLMIEELAGKGEKLSVYSLLGENVLETGFSFTDAKATVSLDGLPVGVYFIKIDGHNVGKVVLKR